MAYKNYLDHTFHDASSTTGNGLALKVDGRDRLDIEITSSVANTARTITFYKKFKNGDLKPLVGYRDYDSDDALSTTATGESYALDITNAYEIVMDLTSITGGTVTIEGRVS